MRPVLIASVAVIGLVAMPMTGEAAPSALHDIVVGKSDIVPTAGGCGPCACTADRSRKTSAGAINLRVMRG